ncbi:MAG TPA: response regulator transcription factor [Acidisarcina sp.]
MRLLVAERDRALGLFLKRGLEADGHEACWVGEAEATLEAVRSQAVDLLVLDMALDMAVDPALDPDLALEAEEPDLEPERGGRAGAGETAGGEWTGRPEDELRLLEAVRDLDLELPVLALVRRTEVDGRVRCLDAGADDCMMKPLSLQELRARCRALLRRPRREAGLVLRCADVQLDRLTHTVERDGRPVPLTNKEFALLEYLMMHRGSCVSRAALLAQVWNQNVPADTNVVDVYINYLRKKLDAGGLRGPMIQTVRGRGYCVDAGRKSGPYPEQRADG